MNIIKIFYSPLCHISYIYIVMKRNNVLMCRVTHTMFQYINFTTISFHSFFIFSSHMSSACVFYAYKGIKIVFYEIIYLIKSDVTTTILMWVCKVKRHECTLHIINFHKFALHLEEHHWDIKITNDSRKARLIKWR